MTSEVTPVHRSEPEEANGWQAAHARLLLASHARLLQRSLLPADGAGDAAQRLYHAPLVVLAHDAAPDPVFFYANLVAQRLFEMPWRQIVCLPSRLSAEPVARAERQRLLDDVVRQGFIENYGGVRISATGKRFRIDGATVWNLLGDQGEVVGQAAAFAAWSPLS